MTCLNPTEIQQIKKSQIQMGQNSCSEFMIVKKHAKSKKSSLDNEIEREGRWTREEKLKYLLFLTFNQSKFECKKKRMFRLYKPLSKFIMTRNSQQCRSHHRKLIQRFKTPKCIISNLNQFFENDDLQIIRKENELKLSELQVPQRKTKTSEKLPTHLKQKSQGRINQNQNNVDQIQDRTRISMNNNEWTNINQNYTKAVFHSNNEMTIVDYQALNWWNQMCLSNFCYFYCPNHSFFIDPSQVQNKFTENN